MTLTFQEVPRPKTARNTSKENPFTPGIELLKEKQAAGVEEAYLASTFELDGQPATTRDGGTKNEDRAIGQVRRLLDAAGRDAGVTVRKHFETTDGRCTVTFWITKKVTRPRKPKDEQNTAAPVTDETPDDATETPEETPDDATEVPADDAPAEHKTRTRRSK